MKVAIVMAVMAGLCHAQAKFEVASVKLSPTPPAHFAYTMTDSSVDLSPIALNGLIRIAYDVEAYQITSPDWMSTTRFDILAKLPAGTNKTQIPEMMRALLAERFGLTTHRESKDQQVYALVTEKNGPALKEGAADNSHPDMAKFLEGRRLLTKIGTDDGFWTITQLDRRRIFDAQRMTMPELARTLSDYVDDPVIDLTGLTGAYQVSIEVPLTVRQMRAARNTGAAADPDGGVSIFASLQKLGLALDHRKAPVEHLVVDHAEKTPTEN